MSEGQFTYRNTRQFLCLLISKGHTGSTLMVWPFSAVISHFKPLQFTSTKFGIHWNAKGGVNVPWQWFPSGENPCARSWGPSELLTLVGAGCPWWAKVALNSQPLLGSTVGQPWKVEQKQHWCHHSQSRPLGKDQRTCPSASPFPVIALSSPLPLGTGVTSAISEGQEEKVCDARCKSTQKNVVW